MCLSVFVLNYFSLCVFCNCSRRFDPRVLPFTGLTLSEGCELNWSMLNTCAPLVAAMAPGRRHEEVGLMAEVINAHRRVFLLFHYAPE